MNVYRVTYRYMERNPGVEKTDTFLVEWATLETALEQAKSYLKINCHFAFSQILGIEYLGKIVSR